jgi:hypothetical protein
MLLLRPGVTALLVCERHRPPLRLPPAALFYTPHVPPKPIVTLPPSTITGTDRRPLL